MFVVQCLASELTHEMTMTDFTPLDVDDMMAAYRHSKSRVIVFDYGGTLLEKEVRGLLHIDALLQDRFLTWL